MATHYEHAHYYDKMAYLRHTLFVRRRTHPPLRSCRDNAKLACHGPARYKMEWIYTQTKMSDQGNVELALIMKKKERKKEMTNCYFFEHLVLACTIVLMNDLGLNR